MPAPTVTVKVPPPVNYPDPGILRPTTNVEHSGATGPTCDVLHEWDTSIGFPSPIQDLNAGITANTADVGVPPSDMGPAGTTWYYRVTVTDNADAQATTSGVYTLDWTAAIDFRRYLYQLGNVGVGFYPIDYPAFGWGPDPDGAPADGDTIDFRQYVHQLGNVGVGFYPIDEPPGGFDAAGGGTGTPGDGYAIDFARYLHQLANVDATTPTPHIWYLFPTYGREGWEFQIVGYGFGDTQGALSGSVTLSALAVGILSWELVTAVGTGMEIDPAADLANPIHQLIKATVPAGAVSGPVIVCTDGP